MMWYIHWYAIYIELHDIFYLKTVSFIIVVVLLPLICVVLNQTLKII